MQQLDKSHRALEHYQEVAQKENLERSYVLQQQHDNLNARWSSCYADLQKEAQKTDSDLKKALHVEIETGSGELAKSESVTQATEAVLVLKKQRISELEAVKLQHFYLIRYFSTTYHITII
jgi:uncharacterized lipoprotein YajG